MQTMTLLSPQAHLIMLPLDHHCKQNAIENKHFYYMFISTEVGIVYG